jgi:hypothetical protein
MDSGLAEGPFAEKLKGAVVAAVDHNDDLTSTGVL